MGSWQDVAAAAQAAVVNAIPRRWHLAERPAPSVQDVRDIPAKCGLLTERQLTITEQRAHKLVSQLQAGELTSEEVTEAFCARAAIAHQCVNCLTDFFYEEAISRASQLDRILKDTGKPIGPLHGLPVAIKDTFELEDKAGTFGLMAWRNNKGKHDASIVKLLQEAGVVEIEPPFNLWEASQVTWKLYFQTGAKEVQKFIASAGEPVLPNFTWYLNTFNIKELSVPELFQCNQQQAAYKRQFAQAWAETVNVTGSGRPIDGLLCPCAPSAGFPHDFPIWWGYFSIWNLLDYPSVILPLKEFQIDPVKDAKDNHYVPKDNVFDRMNWEAYDPELWRNQPVCVQIVKPPYQDEELIAVADVIDNLYNGTSS
ncbi:histidine triad-like protein [Purpureocillium lavendulum]|uniref:Histidine triad-like protein n=1 Tax=Purpureocillium lavendulum TaxID=1247861 RepID=A0AB34G580_9HYPO|nr:histidine triad-like protein [Purpureocillium lavendulum]